MQRPERPPTMDGTRKHADGDYGYPAPPDRAPVTVRVDLGQRGSWHVALPERGERLLCATLDEARRLASRYALRGEPCELVIRDAYHRVLERAVVGGEAGGTPAARPGT